MNSDQQTTEHITRGYLETIDGKRLGVHHPQESLTDIKEMDISINVEPSLWHMRVTEEIVNGPKGPMHLKIHRFLLDEKINGKDFYLDRYCRGRKQGRRIEKVVAFEYWTDRNPAQKWLLEPAEGGGFHLHCYCRLHEYLKINEHGMTVCGMRGEPGDVFFFTPA